MAVTRLQDAALRYMEAQTEADEAFTELQKARGRKRIVCAHCKARTTVSKLVYIQTHFYIEPYSCTAGDYWKPGEGQFECPKCGANNRLYDRRDVVGLKHLFASVEEVYTR